MIRQPPRPKVKMMRRSSWGLIAYRLWLVVKSLPYMCQQGWCVSYSYLVMILFVCYVMWSSCAHAIEASCCGITVVVIQDPTTSFKGEILELWLVRENRGCCALAWNTGAMATSEIAKFWVDNCWRCSLLIQVSPCWLKFPLPGTCSTCSTGTQEAVEPAQPDCFVILGIVVRCSNLNMTLNRLICL